MHIIEILLLLLGATILTHAQSLSLAAQSAQATNEVKYFCGKWAGSPNPQNVPTAQQLPASDLVRRFFIEPQLTNPPYKPIIATEEKVQIPKLWGNNNFRLALLSYYQEKPARRLYSSSKSRWTDFYEALHNLMEACVLQGSGGAYLVPPSPGLTQSTLVLYAYEVGSQFDFTMNYYMSAPYGINPATLGTPSNMTLFDPNVVVPDSPDATTNAVAAGALVAGRR